MPISSRLKCEKMFNVGSDARDAPSTSVGGGLSFLFPPFFFQDKRRRSAAALKLAAEGKGAYVGAAGAVCFS
jgi:hypothetical protein